MSVGADLPIGTELAGYRIEELVGRGGMGVVYRALDLALDRPVALKILAPELAADVDFRERFLRESRLAASIDHPNVIPVYDAGEAGGELYIAMRFVEGSDLKRVLTDGPLPKERTLRVVSQVAAALDAAHARGLVHRDVKPSNVLVGDGDQVYLADFGLTRRLSEAAAALGANRSLGTADYISPEQIRDGGVDGRADLYSLGCLLYECLIGKVPFRRPSEVATLFAHLEEESPAPPGLEKLMRTALAKDPDGRFQSGEELVEATRAALGLEPKRVRWPLAVAAVGVALVGASLLAFFLSQSGSGVTAEKGADTLVGINEVSGKVTQTMPVGRLASGVAADSRYVWVTSAGDGTIWRIDPSTGSVLKLSAHGTPTAVAVGQGRAVIADNAAESLSSFDEDTGALRFTAKLPGDLSGPWLAGGPEGVWFDVPGSHQVGKVDDVLASGTPSEQTTIPGSPNPEGSYYEFDGLAVDEGGVWVAGDPYSRSVWRVDTATGKLAATIRLPFIPGAVAAGDGGVWVTSVLGDTVSRIDPKTNRIVATVPVGRAPSAVVVAGGSVWVSTEVDDSLWRIDPRNSRVTARITLNGAPTRMAAGGGRVWVTLTKPLTPVPKGTIGIGVYADCTSGFGSYYEDALAGAELPLIQAGARLAGSSVRDGVEGAVVDGKPVRLLFGCDAAGDSGTAAILMQMRLLVERAKVAVMIGPTAGQDERIVEQYAAQRPGTTFLDGAGGDPIAHPAPNYFTFIADSAQETAGLGDYARRVLHWRTAITITEMGLFGYGWGQSAAFIGEFCSLGGRIAKRLWIPFGTTDLSGIVSELPRSGVDGAFVEAGGIAPGFNRLLALAVAGPHGNLARRVLIGTPGSFPNLDQLGKRARGLVMAGQALENGAVGGSTRNAYRNWIAAFTKTFRKLIPPSETGIFDTPYDDATTAALTALRDVHGDFSGGEKRLMSALARVRLDLPTGFTTLDSRHRAIAPNYVWQLQGPKLHPVVIRTIPAVSASFGGYFKPTDPPPNRSTPACVKRPPPPWAR
jgi:YVTN family beta-propeller protein